MVIFPSPYPVSLVTRPVHAAPRWPQLSLSRHYHHLLTRPPECLRRPIPHTSNCHPCGDLQSRKGQTGLGPEQYWGDIPLGGIKERRTDVRVSRLSPPQVGGREKREGRRAAAEGGAGTQGRGPPPPTASQQQPSESEQSPAGARPRCGIRTPPARWDPCSPVTGRAATAAGPSFSRK